MKLLANGLKSAKVFEHIRNVQGKTNFLDPDHVDIQSVSSESTDDLSTEMNYPSKIRKETCQVKQDVWSFRQLC